MKKQAVYEQYYFPPRLAGQLDRIQAYPLTLVEAPPGFGKTTAAREYFRGRPEFQTYWYTCLGESPAKSWEGIAGLFGALDRGLAGKLAALRPPVPDTLPDMARLLRQRRSQHQTVLVIDNYHLFGAKIPWDIIKVLSLHGDEKLHIIVITQPLGAAGKITVQMSGIHLIDTAFFRFDTESIGRYFRMEGLRVAGECLEEIQESTGGWIAAIRQKLISRRDSGTFHNHEGMDSLIEAALWNRLDTEEREFLLGLSLLETCTPAEAAVMAGEKKLPEKIKILLRENAFIPFYEGCWHMGGLLRDYLRTVLARDYDEAFRHTLIRRAAEASAGAEDDYGAMTFYYQIGDYEAILSRSYRYDRLYNEQERGVFDFIARIVQSCPGETLRKYPRALLDFAFHLILHDKTPEFERCMSLLREAPAEEWRRIEGETALLRSFTVFNDIRKMGEWLRRAPELFAGKPGRLPLSDMPWTLGNVSVLCLFWSAAGELRQELEAMDEYLPRYSELTCGHGTGADSMMRAEALFLSGKDADAETLCYKALYLAEGAGQTGICICAEFLLARLALFRGDAEKYVQGTERIRRRGEQGGQFYTRMAELCAAALAFTLERAGAIPPIAPWLTEAGSIRKVLPPRALPFGFIVYGKFLLLKKQYRELAGVSEALLSGTGVPYMLPRLYGMIYLVLAKQGEGRPGEAGAELFRALETAKKDRVYMPFAEQGLLLRPLLEDKIRTGAERPSPDRQELAGLINLCKRQEAGARQVEKFLRAAQTPLSAREREIAILARKRRSVREIAGECFISENTVKTLLRNIYRKLNIHSKTELENKVF